MEQFIRKRTRGTTKSLTTRNVTTQAQRSWKRLLVRRRKSIVRYGLLTANLCLLFIVVLFVAKTPSQPTDASAQQNAVAGDQADEAGAVAPLDKVSSADIAVNVARTAGLPESIAITNQADSVSLASTQATSDLGVAAKPQVVASALPSKKDIRVYTVENGDTISSIAAKLGVTSDSIRWSNGLSGERVTVGKQLVVPPSGVNGIVYTVQSGDTPDSLAQKYHTDKDLVISFNDAEVNGLQVGERILIPNGSVQAVAVSYTSYSSTSTGFAWGGNSPIYGRNGYDYGYCTYYAATRVSVPANWGNANTWDSGARASGWTVSRVPVVGAVAQTDGMSWAGHVAYVEAVSPDGSMIKYSDMNNLAGWGRVGYSDWVPASTYQNYIYR